jgi:N-alpha-acetyl-L-2,4-diaminobutyrate deacetylase
MIPIAVIRNGSGPTALLTGGNHGDEYEGPLALYELARTLDPADVSGTVIIIPALNYPAFRAGTRTSPIDKGNMNRSFPGAPDGTVTQKIADYVQRHLLPRADIVLDFHSGGRTLDFVPFCAAHILPDKTQEAKAFAAVEAFAAPYSVKMLEIDAVGMFDTAVEEMGKIFVTTELGGGGTARAETVRIARKGVMNVLRHTGIVAGSVERTPTSLARHARRPIASAFAQDDGLIVFEHDLGEPVRAGEVIARVYPVGKTGLAPAEYQAAMDGVLAARHVPGLIKAGDCLSVLAVLTGAP